MGYASAACMADFIMVNMVAEAVSGSKTPKEAMDRAKARAERYLQGLSASSFNNRHFLGLLFMLPAGVLLLLFLTYPLGLGHLARLHRHQGGRAGSGSASTTSGTSSATVAQPVALQHALLHGRRERHQVRAGLWLALLLNRHIPFKSFFRAIVLLPFIVPTALSALAFWWLYDAQFSVISWTLMKMGLIDTYIDFLGEPWNRAAFAHRGQHLARRAVRRDLPARRLQTISPSLYEAAALDGATPWQRFRYVTLPLLTPIIAVVMTFSVLFTFTDFQLIYVITRGGPLQLDAPHGDALVPARDSGGSLGEGAALATLMMPVPARRDPLQLFRAAAARVAAGCRRLGGTKRTDGADRSTHRRDGYLESLPRRVVTLYLPLWRLRLRPAVPVLLDGDHVAQAERGAAVAQPATRSG
jgi:multiple sugar transport system permease protein